MGTSSYECIWHSQIYSHYSSFCHWLSGLRDLLLHRPSRAKPIRGDVCTVQPSDKWPTDTVWPESAAAWGGQSALRGSQPFLQKKNYITVSLCAAIAKSNVCQNQTYIFNNKLHLNLMPIKTAAVMWMRYNYHKSQNSHSLDKCVLIWWLVCVLTHLTFIMHDVQE